MRLELPVGVGDAFACFTEGRSLARKPNAFISLSLAMACALLAGSRRSSQASSRYFSVARAASSSLQAIDASEGGIPASAAKRTRGARVSAVADPTPRSGRKYCTLDCTAA